MATSRSCRRDGVGLDNVRRPPCRALRRRGQRAYGPRDGGGFRVDLTMPLPRDG